MGVPEMADTPQFMVILTLIYGDFDWEMMRKSLELGVGLFSDKPISKVMPATQWG